MASPVWYAVWGGSLIAVGLMLGRKSEEEQEGVTLTLEEGKKKRVPNLRIELTPVAVVGPMTTEIKMQPVAVAGLLPGAEKERLRAMLQWLTAGQNATKKDELRAASKNPNASVDGMWALIFEGMMGAQPTSGGMDETEGVERIGAIFAEGIIQAVAWTNPKTGKPRGLPGLQMRFENMLNGLAGYGMRETYPDIYNPIIKAVKARWKDAGQDFDARVRIMGDFLMAHMSTYQLSEAIMEADFWEMAAEGIAEGASVIGSVL